MHGRFCPSVVPRYDHGSVALHDDGVLVVVKIDKSNERTEFIFIYVKYNGLVLVHIQTRAHSHQGNDREFRNMFEIPILNGQSKDSLPNVSVSCMMCFCVSVKLYGRSMY